MRVLNHYYPEPPVPLDNRSDFTFLVAVVLSAQTTDGKVNEVTRVLFDQADTPEKMMKLTPSHVQSIIQPVGLAPKKSHFVVELSKMLVERFNGQVPGSYEELESLPGVGHKTASVIMSQLFGQPSFAVDTHVHRLALRWGLSSEQRNVDKVQKDLMNAFPIDSWNKVCYIATLQPTYVYKVICWHNCNYNCNCLCSCTCRWYTLAVSTAVRRIIRCSDTKTIIPMHAFFINDLYFWWCRLIAQRLSHLFLGESHWHETNQRARWLLQV